MIANWLQDDPSQAETATSFIERYCTTDDPGFIGHLTFCQLACVLESNYSQSRTEIATIIEELLQVLQMEAQKPEIIWRALNDYRKSNVDFPEHLLARFNESNGCETTATWRPGMEHFEIKQSPRITIASPSL